MSHTQVGCSWPKLAQDTMIDISCSRFPAGKKVLPSESLYISPSHLYIYIWSIYFLFHLLLLPHSVKLHNLFLCPPQPVSTPHTWIPPLGKSCSFWLCVYVGGVHQGLVSIFSPSFRRNLTCTALDGCGLQLPSFPGLLQTASWFSSAEIQAFFYFICQVLPLSSLHLHL